VADHSIASLGAPNDTMRLVIIATGLLLSTGAAAALECRTSPAPDSKHWAWRQIDNKKCWYAGEPGMAKSNLYWPKEAAPEPKAAPRPAPPPIAATSPAATAPALTVPARTAPAVAPPPSESPPWSTFGIAGPPVAPAQEPEEPPAARPAIPKSDALAGNTPTRAAPSRVEIVEAATRQDPSAPPALGLAPILLLAFSSAALIWSIWSKRTQRAAARHRVAKRPLDQRPEWLVHNDAPPQTSSLARTQAREPPSGVAMPYIYIARSERRERSLQHRRSQGRKAAS
jgi:hypothetical protein